MSHFVFAAALVVGATVSLPAFDADDFQYGPPAVPERLTPKIRIPDPDFNWGAVMQGESVRHSFEVHNDGAGVLRLNQVKASCGCTTVDWTREVQPGGVGEITLEMKTDKVRTASVKKFATISCNDPTQPSVKIHIGGNILQLVDSEPKNVILSGLAGETFETTVTLRPGTDVEIQVQEVSPRSNHIEVVAMNEITRGRHYEVTLMAKASDRPSKLRDTLQLTVLDGEGETRTTTIPVTIEHRDKIQLQPRGNVVFQRKETERLRSPGAQPVQRHVMVSSGAEDIRFKITDVRIEDAPEGLFEAKVETVEEGRQYKIALLLNRYVDQRFVRGKLVIVTDDPAVPERELRLFAQFGGAHQPGVRNPKANPSLRKPGARKGKGNQ